MEKVSLGTCCKIDCGNLDSNCATENGIYPFFTCAPEPLKINSYAFDCDAILLAGNNAAGNFHCNRYNGKFNAYQRTYVLTANKGYDIDYIYYNLLLQLELLKNKSNGSQTKYLTSKILNDIKINKISLKEQQNLVCSLKNIDKQIKRNNEMVQKLQDLGNTIYSNNALSQKETFNIVDIANPIWGVCPSGEHILETKTKSSIKYASGAGDIDDNLISINPKGYTDLPSKKVNKKDICISVAGTVGRVGIANEEIAIGRAMLGFSNKELYGYLYFGLSFYSRTLQKKSTGAIQKIINTSHIEIINLPKYNNNIINQLNNIVDMILDIETQTIKLINLKQQLLPLLINDQLEV